MLRVRSSELKELDECYTVSGRTAIGTEMDKLLVDLKRKMGAVLQGAQKYAIITDIWSKKGVTASFLGVSIHFFSRKNHCRYFLTLAVRRLPLPHTADKVEQMLCEVLKEWGISQQSVSAILTDNGSNMIAAFREWVDDTTLASGTETGDASADENDPYLKVCAV